MGGHEIYCYVCGCPLHNKGEIFDMKLLKKILKDLKSKLTKKKYNYLTRWTDHTENFYEDLKNSNLVSQNDLKKLWKSKKYISKKQFKLS